MAKRTRDELIEEAKDLGLEVDEEASWEDLRDTVELAKPKVLPKANPEDRPPRQARYNELGVWEIS